MSIVEPGGSDAPEIPDGLYVATITKVEDVTLDQPDNFGNQEKVQIHLSFLDSNSEAQTLEPRVNRKWGERANLFAIALAAGLDVSPHEPFDTASLVNRKVNVLVETPEEGRWPRVKSWGRVKQQNGSAPSQAATAAPVKDIAEMNIIEWWKATRQAGYEKDYVIQACRDMFGDDKEPKDLTGEQRQELVAAL